MASEPTHVARSVASAADGTPEFSIFGGPLHRLALRLRLAWGATNDAPIGLAIGLALWLVLAGLALTQGVGAGLLSLDALGAHARLLLVIPLFFVCEVAVDARMREFSRTLVRSGVVPPAALAALRADVARCARWCGAWLPETICLALVVLWSWVWPLEVYGSGASQEHGQSWASHWYWGLCLPVFRFLMLRWLWHIGLWTFFLWRVSRLPLHLVPTHPDGAAGLGFVEVVQTHFTPLTLATSLTLAVSFAHAMIDGTMNVEAIYAALALILAINVLLLLGPPLVFIPKLWRCRVQGLADYAELGQRYVSAFARKWIADGARNDADLLGTADLEPLAAVSGTMTVVRNMRLVPVSLRLVMEIAIAALLPMLPLLLIKYPIGELLKMLASKLSGY